MLTWVLAAGAVLCLVYFIAILMYSGMGTAHVLIWLLLACVLEQTQCS